MECTDLVIFSLSSPYSDVLKVENRLFTIFNQNITLKQQWKPGGNGGTEIGFGASVYNSSIVLSYFIEYIQESLCNKIGIEIGKFIFFFFK